MRCRVALLAIVLAVAPVARAQEAAPAGGQTGTVSGTVIDRSSGDPIIEAGVEAVGTGRKTTTDLDGKYSLRLQPGKYEIRIFAPLYQGTRLQNVVVEIDRTAKVDAALGSAGKAGVEVVEVVAQANKAAEATQLVQRKTAPVVMDTIAAESIKKAPGSKATDVVQRTPSVTIKEDKYVVVRGLDERYTSATLNGSRLPSTDPLKRVIPLDLFPAEFFDSFGIIKSYSPDLPGDFSGGLVEMRLKDFPEQLTYSFGVSTGANTQTTGQDFLTYKGSDLDWVTYGEDFRTPPQSVPSFSVDELSESQRSAIGRQFKDIWTPENETAPPNFGSNFSVGNSWGPLGVQFGAIYSTEFLMRRNEIKRQFENRGTREDPDVGIRDDFRADVGTFQTRLGGLLTTAYRLSDRHKFTLRTFINRTATDETTREFGTTPQLSEGTIQRQTRLAYVADQLALGQLSGEHEFEWFRTDWRSVLAQTTRDEPDTRHTTYQGPVEGPLAITNDSLGGLRINNTTKENLTDSMLDFTVPFRTRLPATDFWRDLPGKFKFGPAYSYRKRDFAQRRFEFLANSATQDTTLPAEDLFRPDQIGIGEADFLETTQPRDSFTASQEIAAAYGPLELPIVRDRLRVIGGTRVEYSLIRMESFVDNIPFQGDPLNGICGPVSEFESCNKLFRKRTLDVLPAVSAIYSPRDDMNLRFSWSETVSRPEFRELAPVEFPAQRGDRARFGNPDLVEANIVSYDWRYEWFFSPLELYSIGAFYKQLSNPIELIQVVRGADIAETWSNAGDATLVGVEGELRKDLGFVHRALKPFRFIGNITYTDSQVETPRTQIFGLQTQQTSLSRSLQGQSPLVVNAILEYDRPDVVTASLLYYTQGETLVSVGSQGVPDTFLQQRNKLDAAVVVPLERWLDAPLTAKFAVENILNDPYVRTQGGFVQRRWTNGVKFTLGLSVAY